MVTLNDYNRILFYAKRLLKLVRSFFLGYRKIKHVSVLNDCLTQMMIRVIDTVVGLCQESFDSRPMYR